MTSVVHSVSLSEDIEEIILKMMKVENRNLSNVIDNELRKHWGMAKK